MKKIRYSQKLIDKKQREVGVESSRHRKCSGYFILER